MFLLVSTSFCMFSLMFACTFLCVLHTGANPLQTNGLGHAARAYAKEGEVGKVLLEFEGKV